MEIKKILSVLFLQLFLAGALLGQGLKVQGTVVDNTGAPLPGVNVLLQGTYTGTVTNIDGFYLLEVPSKESVLVFSFIGMTNVVEPVDGRTMINVTMSDDSQQLEDVIVVAYGTSTKEAYTGAAQVIESEMMEDRPVTSFEKALQGTTAGLQISSSSGQPGSGTTVRIRGIGSLSASSAPLYVIDGVPMAGALNDINPNDIESVTVLKDAAASSLYGSRAANGVIMITTKKGKAGQTQISVSSQVGVSSRISDGYALMNASDYYQHTWQGLYNQALIQEGQTLNEAIDYAHNNVQGVAGFNPFGIDNPLDDNGMVKAGTKVVTNTDWRDLVYKTGTTQNYNLNASGGNENTNVFMSLGYFSDSGTTLASNYERITAKVNVNHKVNSFITAGMSANLSASETNAPPGGTGFANPVRSADIINAASPLYSGDGTYNFENKAVFDFNPVALAEMDIYQIKGRRVISNAYINIDFTPNFYFRSTGGIDFDYGTSTTYYNPYHGDGRGVNGRSIKGSAENIQWTVSNILNWTKSADDSNIEVLVGQEAIGNTTSSLSGEVTDFSVAGKPDLTWGSKPQPPYSGLSEWRMLSFLGQAKYNYLGRYYVSGSVRTDGSSRFGPSTKWGLFYSVGASWRLTEENWLKNTDWLNNLKLRVSYGTSGNSSIGNYASYSLYSSGANYAGLPGISYAQIGNRNIAWEKIASLNIGAEARLFNFFGTTLEYYQRKSDGLLFNLPLSAVTGIGAIQSNLGAMSNQGFEGTFSFDIFNRGKFSYTADFNISYNINKVLKLSVPKINSGNYLYEEGSSMYQFYLRDYAGVNPDNGRPMWFVNQDSDDKDGKELPGSAYVDPHGSGRQVTSAYVDAERVRMGTALPDVYGGVNNHITFGNFDLSCYIYYSLGGQIYNGDYATNMHDGTSPAYNLAKDALNAWTPDNRYTDVPRYITSNVDYGNQLSSRFLEDASFVRLKNISLGYNLPQQVCSRLHLSGVKAFVSGENLFTLTNYKGFDPEQALSGSTGNNIPGVKVYTVGLKVDF